jgi:hypothetical protein
MIAKLDNWVFAKRVILAAFCPECSQGVPVCWTRMDRSAL